MLSSYLSMLHGHDILAPVSAANTAAATSPWKDFRGHEGLVGIVLYTGAVPGAATITYTFETATSAAGANAKPLTPRNAPPAVVTNAVAPHIDIAVFDTAQIEGYLRVTGTIAGTGPIVVSFAGLAMDKYG